MANIIVLVTPFPSWGSKYLYFYGTGLSVLMSFPTFLWVESSHGRSLMTQLPVHLVLSLTPREGGLGEIAPPLWDQPCFPHMEGQDPRPWSATAVCWAHVCPMFTDSSSRLGEPTSVSAWLYLAHRLAFSHQSQKAGTENTRPAAFTLQTGRKGDFSSPIGAGEHLLGTLENRNTQGPAGAHSLAHSKRENKIVQKAQLK